MPGKVKALKQQKKEEAEARQKSWKKLSPKQKLTELDSRLGQGVGARRQRDKLGKEL